MRKVEQRGEWDDGKVLVKQCRFVYLFLIPLLQFYPLLALTCRYSFPSVPSSRHHYLFIFCLDQNLQLSCTAAVTVSFLSTCV
jgi:hypothetical protein